MNFQLAFDVEYVSIIVSPLLPENLILVEQRFIYRKNSFFLVFPCEQT